MPGGIVSLRQKFVQKGKQLAVVASKAVRKRKPADKYETRRVKAFIWVAKRKKN